MLSAGPPTPHPSQPMSAANPPDDPDTRRKIYAAYRDYFDLAERKRRWNVREDIPWDQCNNGIDPVVADVVQTFCMVELYLPDYVAKQLPPVRANRGRAWMLAHWGDREAPLAAFRPVVNTFRMPADGLLADGRQRAEAVRALGIFDERVFHGEVYQPLMRRLGLTRADLKPKKVFRAA